MNYCPNGSNFISVLDDFGKIRLKLKVAEETDSTDLNTPLDDPKMKKKRVRKRRGARRYSPGGSSSEGDDHGGGKKAGSSLENSTKLKCPTPPPFHSRSQPAHGRYSFYSLLTCKSWNKISHLSF